VPDAQDVGREVRHVHGRVASMTVAREACSIALGDCTEHSIRPSRDRRTSTRFAVAARTPSGSA